ncbi:hypothetical protein JCM3774_001578 [Rhodotorula dairenensis]
MGSILLATLLGSGETLADLRSPILPVPEDHPHLSAASSTTCERRRALVERDDGRSRAALPLTERSLRAYHLAWLVRQRDLRSRHLALCDARDKGWPSCWAGKATSRHIRAVSRALDEAQWVEDKLRKALGWCRAAAVPKARVKSLLKSGKKRSVRVPTLASMPSPRGPFRLPRLVVRPSHTDFPPSLLDLPYPLPVALEANIYFLTVPRPPTLTRRDEEREAQLRDAPPAYCEEVDFFSGETVLEVGQNDADVDVRAYERLTHAAPTVTTVTTITVSA